MGKDVSIGLSDTVRRLLAEKLDIVVASADTDLLDGGLLDSLALVNLIVALEQAFGIGILDRDFEVDSFRTADRIAAFIEDCRQAA